MNQLELDRQHELADFLRSRRARLSPERVGLPAGTRRRTPGLRRAEVASLAGVSPEWYTWLEQGRDIHVSGQVLESLARVLHLDENERAHLFLLAHRQMPPVETFIPPVVSRTLQQFLDQLGTTPASALDARLNVIAWNAAFLAIFGDYPRTSMIDYALTPGHESNLLWRLFTAPGVEQNNEEWKHLACVYVAQFRAGYGRFVGDPWWVEQIAELSQLSPVFRELWSRHDVHNVSEGRKKMHHPVAGELDFDFLWLQTFDSSDVRLLIHNPRPNSGTAEKIARLLGLESEPNGSKTTDATP